MERFDGNFDLNLENPLFDLFIDSNLEGLSLGIVDEDIVTELPSVDRSMYLLTQKLGDLKQELEVLKYYLKDLDDSFSP